MSTLELKLEIFDKLKSVEDASLLRKIMDLLKPVDQNEIYHLNEYELDMVKEGEEDIKAGRVISQEQLDKEDLEWLSQQ
jgi:predicted transcriptional regulator